MLDDRGPQQWPLPRRRSATGRARLYEDGVFPTPDGRARFVDTPYKPVAEQREARFPFSLNTGRLRDQWHGMSRTGTLGRLFGHVAEPVVQMNAQDMARRQIKEGDLVHADLAPRLASCCRRRPAREVGMSQAFVAMHWGEEYLSGRAAQRRAARRHQRAHQPGLLPRLEAARAQARGRQDPEGRAALVAARRGLAAGRRGAGHAAGAARR